MWTHIQSKIFNMFKTYLVHSFNGVTSLPLKMYPSDLFLTENNSYQLMKLLLKSDQDSMLRVILINWGRGHGGRLITLSPPTSEAGVQFPAWPHVGKLVVACRWSSVYSTEP